jgi:hypothetical protein
VKIGKQVLHILLIMFNFRVSFCIWGIKKKLGFHLLLFFLQFYSRTKESSFSAYMTFDVGAKKRGLPNYKLLCNHCERCVEVDSFYVV